MAGGLNGRRAEGLRSGSSDGVQRPDCAIATTTFCYRRPTVSGWAAGISECSPQRIRQNHLRPRPAVRAQDRQDSPNASLQPIDAIISFCDLRALCRFLRLSRTGTKDPRMNNLFNLPRIEHGIEEEILPRMNADKRGYEVWNKKPNSLVRFHPRLSAFIRGTIDFLKSVLLTLNLHASCADFEVRVFPSPGIHAWEIDRKGYRFACPSGRNGLGGGFCPQRTTTF